jgi:murein DD-endopeptidase MepM/ murein hydrolase activator NlpD
MIQNSNSCRISHRIFSSFLSQRVLLIAGIGWLGGISFLSTLLINAEGAIAQSTVSEAASEAAVPSAQDLLMPQGGAAEPAPAESQPAASQPEASQPTVDQLVVPVAPEPSAAESAAPIEASGAASASPAGNPPSEAASSTPGDALVSPNLENNAKAVFGQSGGGQSGAQNSYIDSTPYSLGATKPDVVLSERSTGCEAVIQPGQSAPASICPAPAFSTGASAGGYTTVSASAGGYGGSVTMPSMQDFYNLTVRPPALLGNGNLKLLFPLTIPAMITSAFGWRIHPISGESRFHSGTDLGAPMGAPVVAVFDGKVQIADLMGGYGLAIVLRHNKDTEETLYGHLSEIFVKPGDTVKQGDVIGRVGSTGYSTGPHLHFEFRQLTSQGWVTLDSGRSLEYSLAQMIQGLKPGAQPKPVAFAIRWDSLKKALEMAERQKAQMIAPVGNPKLAPSAEQPISSRPSQPDRFRQLDRTN